MTRVSLKEAYDNKDIVAQIYAIRDTAESAVDTAEQAVTTANTASAHVDALIPEVESAVAKADENAWKVAGFANRLTTAEGEIGAVTPVAESALNTANTAVTTAKTAVATADIAGEKAKTAVNTASDAVKTAKTAVENAKTAIENANTAVASATDAAARADASASTVEGFADRLTMAESELDALQSTGVTLDTDQEITGKKTFSNADGVNVTNDLSVGGVLHVAETAEIGNITLEPSGTDGIIGSAGSIAFNVGGTDELVLNSSGATVDTLDITTTPGSNDPSTKAVTKDFVQNTSMISNIVHYNQANTFRERQAMETDYVSAVFGLSRDIGRVSFCTTLRDRADSTTSKNQLVFWLDLNSTTGQIRLRVQKKTASETTTYYVPLTTDDTWM